MVADANIRNGRFQKRAAGISIKSRKRLYEAAFRSRAYGSKLAIRFATTSAVHITMMSKTPV
jgi:hypothetical protein